MVRAEHRQRRPVAEAYQAALCACLIVLCSCSPERRWIGPSQPSNAPTSLADPRQHRFGSNVWDLSTGQRMFRWFGCDGCHTPSAVGVLQLSDRQWRHGGSIPEIYQSIQGRHPDGGRLPPDLVWAMAGYVAAMPETPAPKASRQASALKGEPQGAGWPGAMR